MDPNDEGGLNITDNFLRAYWQRPEVLPIDGSCSAELSLHNELMANPRRVVKARVVKANGLNAFEDPDAIENFQLVLDFRDRLVAAKTIETAYVSIFQNGPTKVPPVFIDQMAQVLARHLVGTSHDPFRARASELLFREQQATIADGAILLGDRQTVDMLGAQASKDGGFGSMGELLVQGGIKPKQVELDVLLENTAADYYWPRNEKFDTVLDITFPRPGLDGLCRMLELWIKHLLSTEVNIQPVQEINDERWVWYVGLDAGSTALLNDLYEGETIEEDRLKNLLSLFRLNFKDPSLMKADIAGSPVYLALCKTNEGYVRMKPQNLIMNLPLAQGT